MENIFENAKFGDCFSTRDGRKAVYIKHSQCDDGMVCVIYEGIVGICMIMKDGHYWATPNVETDYDIVSEWQEETDAVSKVCEVYKKELLEIQDTFNKVGETLYGVNGLGEILSIEGSVEDFRKALVGHG